MPTLYPQIVDKSVLTGLFNVSQFFAVGVEGQMDNAGDATPGLPELIRSAEDANQAFGPASSLAALSKFLLGRGLSFVWAVASAKGTPPLLADRQVAWGPLEDNVQIRVRLTDDMTQATLAALADSCENAEGVQNKQWCAVGLNTPSSKANLISAAGAIASKRAVLVGPGIFDDSGNLLSGAYGAAVAAAVVAQNPDLSDSLNTYPIPATGGIELEAATGMPLFRLRANGGAPINDFADLLDEGVSPFQTDASGIAAFTHLRTTYTVDDTYDALMTLLIKDQTFINIRELLMGQKFLRRGNTANNRSLAAAQVDAYLTQNGDLIQKVVLPDGTLGYGVNVVPSDDLKSFTIHYKGQVIRGTNEIDIAGQLSIPVGG